MDNILAISRFTVREALSRKIFVAFFAISTFVILLFAVVFASVPIEDFSGMIRTNGTDTMKLLERISMGLKVFVVAPLYGGGLFLSIFSASSFIPNMLEKGHIDLILSKPISRAQIILGKFSGGVVVVFLNVAFLIISLWFLFGIKFGVWDISFLSVIILITFTFAVLYSLIILIGILTTSSIFAMMLTYLIFFVLSPILSAREQIGMLFDNKIIEKGLEVLYYIVPKTSELGLITTDLASGGDINSFQPIITSFVFLILILYLSIFIFSKKDY